MNKLAWIFHTFIILNGFTTQGETMSSCLWGQHIQTGVYDSPLTKYLGALKVMTEQFGSAPATIPQSFPCTYHNRNSTDEGIWDCNITAYDIRRTHHYHSRIYTILRCGSENKCPSNKTCEDHYCINICSNDDVCQVQGNYDGQINPSIDLNMREDCLLNYTLFTSHLWGQNTSLFGCLSNGNCLSNQTCIYQRCKPDPCLLHQCGLNMKCTIRNYKPICTCTRGTFRQGQESSCQPIFKRINACSRIDDFGTVWNVKLGKVGSTPCPSNASGASTWKCGDNGRFVTSGPDYSDCVSLWVSQIVMDSEKIDKLENAVKFFEKLANDTKDPKRTSSLYFGAEIPKIVNATRRAINNFKGNGSFDELLPIVKKSLQSGDNLFKSEQQWRQLPKEERVVVLTELIESFESTASLLASKLNISNQTKNNQTEFQVLRTNTTIVKVGTFSSANSTNTEVIIGENIGPNDGRNSKAELDIGNNSNTNGTLTYVAFFLEGQMARNLFPNTNNGNGNQLINGKVLTLTIVKSEINGDGIAVINDKGNSTVQYIKNATVTVTFQHDHITWGSFGHDLRRKCKTPSAVLESGVCVYWDIDQLKWSTDGCELIKSTNAETKCRCTHLTSFAILMDSHNCRGEDIVLETLTIVFCSISAICLLLTIVIYTFAKSASKRVESLITKHLCFYLLVGNILLIFVLDKDFFNLSETICAISGAFAHFVFTHAFVWMAVEGLHLYGLLFRIGKRPFKWMTLTRYKISSVVMSLLVVGVTFGLGIIHGDGAYGNQAICWINDGYIWGFNGLVAVVILINSVILCKTFILAYSRGNRHLRSNKDNNHRKCIMGCLSLTTLLGIGWIFGYFMLLPGIYGHIAAYAFTFLCATQGIFIFILYCAKNDNIREDLKRLYYRYRQDGWSGITLDAF